MGCCHLTVNEKYTVEMMSQAGHSNTAIAKAIGRDKSTVGRELWRNRSQRGDRHQHAQRQALARRTGKSPVKGCT